MKIAIGMKSNFAFDRLITTLSKSKYIDDMTLYKDNHDQYVNVQDLNLLDDVINFWEPDLIILDSKLPQFDELDTLANDNEIQVVYFNSDFEAVINYVTSFFEEEDNVEEQIKDIHYVKREEPIRSEIIIKDRVIEKEVIKTAYTSIPNKLIVCASLWQGAGSTTFAINLARALSNRGLDVSYIEFPLSKPYMFDYLSIPLKEETKKMQYVDYSRKIVSRKSVRRSKAWSDYGIDWYVNDSRYEPLKKFTYEDMLKFIYSINSTITIVDVSSHLHNSDVQKFLHHVDDIYVCVEPDPVKVDWLTSITEDGIEIENQRNEKKSIDFLNDLERKEGVAFQFVNMKYTKKIDNKLFWESLGKKPVCFFPVIDYEVLLNLVWESRFLYDSEDYQDTLEKALKPAIVNSVPRQFYELENKKISQTRKKFISVFKKGEK